MKTLYVLNNGKTEGPFTYDQIVQLIRSGLLHRETPSALEGDQEWRPLGERVRALEPDPAAPRKDVPAGQAVGIFLLVAALGCLIYALTMDVSVPFANGYGRVNNLGLLADRQTFLILGGLGAVIATLLIIFCKRPAR